MSNGGRAKEYDWTSEVEEKAKRYADVSEVDSEAADEEEETDDPGDEKPK